MCECVRREIEADRKIGTETDTNTVGDRPVQTHTERQRQREKKTKTE